MKDALEAEIEAHLEQMGFDLVELERAGSRARPILRLRIDRVTAAPESDVTHDDCHAVSRSVEALLESRPDIPERYVLEVSSPGVERPLVRPRDFERFAGKEIAIVAREPIHGNAKRVEGELIGLREGEAGETILLRLPDGSEVAVARDVIKRVHLVFRWGGVGREG